MCPPFSRSYFLNLKRYFCQAGRTVSFRDLPSLKLSSLGVTVMQSHARWFTLVLWFELSLHWHSKLLPTESLPQPYGTFFLVCLLRAPNPKVSSMQYPALGR